jgi:hypothetical protein
MPSKVAGVGGGCEATPGVFMRVSHSPHAPVSCVLLGERQACLSLRIRSFNKYSDLW